MTETKPLDDLDFGIPEVEEKDTASPLNEAGNVSYASSRKEPWNPQPRKEDETIADKNGNAF
jgi:hypothetical protein